ncbi:hypothetical protein [Paraburkholderia graminis]|uniref:hypothetical protein n=1 Tax=Paraburkholderia graminis TaxID=60548 RepID=UPI0038B91E41
MSKIVQAVNSMIANKELISDVVRGDAETFFRYKNKYTWSISKRDDGYTLWLYPGKQSIDELLDAEASSDWRGVEMVVYKDSEIGTKEAKASFSELYTVVKEKLYGVDRVLDDIISDDLL